MGVGYEIVRVPQSVVIECCERWHSYGSAGTVSVYSFAVVERGEPVAVYSWMPPPPGAAKSVCPEAHWGVLALSRMAACARSERELNHVSKPLRRQMKRLIDRGRWPVLVTYSDESKGHTGHVYKCSGWQRTDRRLTTQFEFDGVRVSRYQSGRRRDMAGATRVSAWLQRWEHWACERGRADEHMIQHGWARKPTGKTWRNGSERFCIVNTPQMELF